MKISTLNSCRATVRRVLLSLACCTALAANADVVEGEVYTIVLANETGSVTNRVGSPKGAKVSITSGKRSAA